MDKWTGFVIIVIMISLFVSIAIRDVAETQRNVDLAKAGLEECPVGDSKIKTIWVKDCIKYKAAEK